MNIGEPKRVREIEPVSLPVPEAPEEEPVVIPQEEPVEEPARSREHRRRADAGENESRRSLCP